MDDRESDAVRTTDGRRVTRPERPFAELSDEGLLWLINRVVFHPRGFALAVHKTVEGVVTGWSMIGDGSEVWAFKEADDDEEFAKATRYLRSLEVLGPEDAA